jgi:uncharacterized protein YjbK
MSQNIEIEFKNMLTESEFNILLKHFSLNESHFFKQVNHYFDTPDFSLKQHGSNLRIREKKDSYEMTLKQPHPDGLLESNEKLDKKTAQSLIEGAPLTDGFIKEQLLRLDIQIEHLCYFGSLETKRATVDYHSGELALDLSTYLNMQDYEVEYEVNDRLTGEAIFVQLLSEVKIPLRKAKNKVQRFYERKLSLEPQ